MKHMMTFDIVQPLVGAFQTEESGWDHANEVANGREVRLVQSRQIDQDQNEVKDLQDSAFAPNAETGVCGFVVIAGALTVGFVVGFFARGMM